MRLEIGVHGIPADEIYGISSALRGAVFVVDMLQYQPIDIKRDGDLLMVNLETLD